MVQADMVRIAARCAVLLLCLTAFGSLAPMHAQEGGDIPRQKEKVNELLKEQKYVEALPILQELAIAEPENAETQFLLGFALIAKANTTKDLEARKALRVRSRRAFLRSKELGNTDPVIDGLVQSISPDGSDGKALSQVAEANSLMAEAEGFFSQGKLDDALKSYQKALQLDPKIYEAALFSGDVYTQRGNYQQAEFWYQRAIAIDPKRETAYRYSATPLMLQGKHQEACERYVEAYLNEPYNRFTASGLNQWAQATGTKLAHPDIKVPTNVTFDEKGDVKIDLDASALLDGKDDGSFAWISYGTTRSRWRKEKFAGAFPAEKVYRHSLAEEADALRSVLALAASDKKTKRLSPSLERLKKLNVEGVLEAYILLARTDEGIARDYASYLSQNRDKLRKYVVEYILTGGGK